MLTPVGYNHVFRINFGNGGSFRNADGSKKGAGIAGAWANGVVTENGDIFYDIPVLVTSLEEELSNFNYYPNPTQGILNFSGEIPGRVRTLNIFNLKGEKVLEKAINNNTLAPIDITGYEPGLYLLSIVTDQRKYTFKVLVNPY